MRHNSLLLDFSIFSWKCKFIILSISRYWFHQWCWLWVSSWTQHYPLTSSCWHNLLLMYFWYVGPIRAGWTISIEMHSLGSESKSYGLCNGVAMSLSNLNSLWLKALSGLSDILNFEGILVALRWGEMVPSQWNKPTESKTVCLKEL